MLGWSVSPGLTRCRNPRAPKYGAFIACSESDAVWVDWLVHRLERFQGDRHSSRHTTAEHGRPRSLYPIFRDAAHGRADYSLPQHIIAALDASKALIVICSPAAAKSYRVNEEIRLFKLHHPHRPIVPLIIGGKPGDDQVECFPPLLQFQLNAEGCITGGPIDVQATDARDGAGGHEVAIARIASDLLGISSSQMDGHTQTRGARLLNNPLKNSMNLAVAAGIGALFVWQGLRTNQAFLDETLALLSAGLNTAAIESIDRGVPRNAVLELLAQGEGLLGTVASLGRSTPEIENRKAAMLLELAHTYRSLGEKHVAEARTTDAHHLLETLRAEASDGTLPRRRLEAAQEALGGLRAVRGNSP